MKEEKELNVSGDKNPGLPLESEVNEQENQVEENVVDVPQVNEQEEVQDEKVQDEPVAEVDDNPQSENIEKVDEPTSEEVSSSSAGSDLEDIDHQEEQEEPEEEVEIDYSTFTKTQLADAIRDLAQTDNVLRANREASKMAPLFNAIRKQEKDDAMRAFLADGGEESEFEVFHDEVTDQFEANFRLIRDKKREFFKDRESEQQSNLETKLVVLEKLRQFVDSEETNISFNDFKAIQEEWRSIGPVPPAHNRTLWANYHALLDRFYDNRSIYFELKELDRKKNLESKNELCEKAEGLAKVEQLKEAIKELNQLHDEFKHIGPVPKDDQESIWLRFKAASDAVYARRKEYVEELKVKLDANLVLKLELCTTIEEFTAFNSDRINEWNAKTKEILELQKKWEGIGGVPRAKAKEVNKRFWGGFKNFFNHKNSFFKKLDGEREANLTKKQELIGRAAELKESTEWDKTAEAFKKLQNEWREIGPVPQKLRESTYKEFKAHCDHFFDQRRSNLNHAESEYQENLKKKEEICKTIESLAGTKEGTQEKLTELEAAFDEVGFVPKKAIKSIRNKFKSAVDGYISKIEGLSAEEKEQLILQDEIRQIASGPNADQKLSRKQQGIRKEIGQLENDISLWKNNLEFFASSKTADKLKEEFNTKIDKATGELEHLKKQLRMLRKV